MKAYKTWFDGWVLLVFITLGALAGLQIKTTTALRQQGNPQGARTEVVLALYRNAQEELDRRGEEIKNLRQQIEDQQKDMAQGISRYESLRRELERMKIMAGLVPVKGPGVIVDLADSPKRVSPEEEQNLYMIHDSDIGDVVNELKAAGAEAISVNGQRIVALSAIRCSGPIIEINGKAIPSPYEIRAIGDPDTLESALNLPMGILDRLRLATIVAKVTKQPEGIEIPALAVTPTPRFAVPAQPEPEASSSLRPAPSLTEPGAQRK